jgi:hypothetical protein
MALPDSQLATPDLLEIYHPRELSPNAEILAKSDEYVMFRRFC